MINVNHVTKQFDTCIAVEQVSFQISQGEALGVLGPNGAGKTTLFKLIAGFLYPDAGNIQPTGPTRPRIGFKPDHLLYPGNMRVRQYLELVAQLSNIERHHIPREVTEALERVRLTAAADKRIKECSKGMRQRLGLAQVLIGHPPLLLIDEPSNGLDPAGQADICRLLQELDADGYTIVLSSHQLAEVKRVCTHLIILNHGKIHYENSMEKALALRPHITIQATEDLGGLRVRLESLHPGVHVDGALVRLEDEAVNARREVLRLIVEAGLDICHLEQQRATLEEIYAEVVQ